MLRIHMFDSFRMMLRLKLISWGKFRFYFHENEIPILKNNYKNLRNFHINFLIIADKIEIFDLYKIDKHSDVSLKPFGIYDSALNISVPEMWERRIDMEGHHLRLLRLILF